MPHREFRRLHSAFDNQSAIRTPNSAMNPQSAIRNG